MFLGSGPIVCIGWSSRLVREDLLGEVRAPSNYKDKEKISAYVAEASAKRAARMQRVPLAASLDEIHYAFVRGGILQGCIATTAQMPAAQAFLEMLSASVPGVPNDPRDLPTIFGFGVREFFSLMACDLLTCRLASPPADEVGALSWAIRAETGRGGVDPYDIIPSVRKDDVPVSSLLKLLSEQAGQQLSLDSAASSYIAARTAAAMLGL